MVGQQAQPALTTHAALCTALCLWLALAGCAPSAPDPEAELRALVAEAERLAEARDASGLMELVDPAYRDEAGNGPRELERLLRLVFLRNRDVFLFTRIAELDLPEPGRARLTVFAAMAGHRAPEHDPIPLRASFYRFDLQLARSADAPWRLMRAHWRPATRADLLAG